MISNNKKYLLFIALFIAFHMHPNVFHKPFLGKVVDSIGASNSMSFINKNIYAPLYSPLYETMFGNEPASAEYQILGKEAQNALGIPAHRQLPIKKIPSTSAIAHLVGALAQPNAIYVNEEKLNQRPYGARHCALLHEATHVKYNDAVNSDVLSDGGWLISSIATYKLLRWTYPEQRKLLLGTAAAAGNFIVIGILGMKHKRYIERRADIEGHYASQCAVCVQESAAHRRQSFEEENNPLKNNGYLQADDLLKIANDLEKHHKICAYHAQLPAPKQ